MSSEIIFKSATELADQIKNKQISSVELTQAYIDQIERFDDKINAVPVRRFDRALQEAEKADEALARGESHGPLHGVPMTIKESYVMKDTPSTWGDPKNKDNVSDKDGLIVSRFKEAGAHFLGKTNVPLDLADFQSYNDIYGTTNNPWNLEHTPGGSSGGSAAATAAGFSGLEAGSDIGGSVRTPAHYSGVFGLKPTWGIVPMAGHEIIEGVPDADVSVCGPLARSAEDLALALSIMAGPTERESVGWSLSLAKPDISSLKDMRVVLWPTDDLAPVDDETQERVHMIGDTLSKLGAKVSDTARPEFDIRKSNDNYLSLTNAVMSSGKSVEAVARIQESVGNLDPADGSQEAVNMRAAVMLHRDWIRHDFRREKFRRAWDEFFKDWDIVVCPQSTAPAIKHDHRPWAERSMIVDGEERPYGEHIFWAGLPNNTYLPSTCFPTGLSKDGLPIGIQAFSPSYRDYRTIEFARLITQEMGGFSAPEWLAS